MLTRSFQGATAATADNDADPLIPAGPLLPLLPIMMPTHSFQQARYCRY